MLPRVSNFDYLDHGLSNGHVNHSRLTATHLPEIGGLYSQTSARQGTSISPVTWQPTHVNSSRQGLYVSPRINAYSLDGSGLPIAPPSFNYDCADPQCSYCRRPDLITSSLLGSSNYKPRYDTDWRNHAYGHSGTGRPHHQYWTYTHSDTHKPRYDTTYDLLHAPSHLDAIDWASHRNASFYNRLRDTRATLGRTVQHLRALDNPYQSTYQRDFDFDMPKSITPFEMPPTTRRLL